MRRRGGPGAGQPSPVWLMLIAALGLILAASIVRAQGGTGEIAPPVAPQPESTDDPADAPGDTPNIVTLSGTVEPCLLPHGNPETYRATLRAVGWADIAPEDRPAAIDRLARLWLPVTGKIDGSWDDHRAHIPAALSYWEVFSTNRSLMRRGGQVLALAGISETDGTLRVECWIAGDTTPVTDFFFDVAGLAQAAEGIELTQIGVPAADGLPATDYLLIRINPPAAHAAAIPGGDGMRTGITFPFPAQ